MVCDHSWCCECVYIIVFHAVYMYTYACVILYNMHHCKSLVLSLLSLQPLQHNPYTEPLWKAAVAQYNRGVAPAELRIATKLRNKFHELEAQPHQLLREFQRYKELVRRPAVSKELIPERLVS